MKKTFNFIKNLLLFMYIFLIIFVTICLLSFNDYKVTEFGKSTLLPVVDDDLKPNFNKGDLLIINKVKLDELKNDDIVFFYRTRSGVTTVNFGRVTNLERVTDTETTITIEGNVKFSSSNLIGTANSTTVIQNVGFVLSLLESKWGFLALGVFPSLIVFLYTLYSVVLEFYLVRKSPQKGDEEKTEKKVSNEEDEKIKALEEKLSKLKEAKKEKENQEDEKTKKIRELEEKIKNIENTDTDEPRDIEEKNINEKEEINVEEEINKIKEDIKPKKIEPVIEEQKENISLEEEKKKKIEEKMKSLTDEQKRALIEAKLKSMTPEQKRALIEAKRKKMEEKNGD